MTTADESALNQREGRIAVASDYRDGVVDVLHRAPSGTLWTRSGSFEVRPADCVEEDFLFSLDIVDAEAVGDLESLEIDELELDFGDARFAVDGAAVSTTNGRLFVSRPDQVLSSQMPRLPVEPGVLRLVFGAGSCEVVEFALDELVVAGCDPAALDLTARSACLEYEGEFSESIECRVVFNGALEQGRALLRLLDDAKERPGLARIARQLRFPQLRDRGELGPERVIELFRASHYLELRETDDAGPSEPWCCPDFAGDLSFDQVYEANDGTLLGHVSVTRAYARTWLGHQLTTLKGHRDSAACRVALYNFFASVPAWIDGDAEHYLLGYYNRDQRWHQLFFEAFVGWYGDADEVAVVPFDRFELAEADTPRRPLAHDGSNVEICRAEPSEREALVELIAAQLPDIAREAFDLRAETLDCEYLHPDYAERKLGRGRQCFVVYQDGVRVAAALCETGNRNLSLFNLFNLAQLYFTVEASPRARAQLARFVRSHYAAQGISDPLIVAPPGSFAHPGDAGLRLDETMGCIIWSGQTLGHYRNYLRTCFERIDARSLTAKAG